MFLKSFKIKDAMKHVFFVDFTFMYFINMSKVYYVIVATNSTKVKKIRVGYWVYVFHNPIKGITAGSMT